MPSKLAARWAPLLAAGLLLTACGDDQGGERADLPDWSDGYPGSVDAGTSGDMVVRDAGPPYTGDDFAIQIPESFTAPYRLRREGTLEPCAVDRDASRNDIRCILDMDELDVMYLDLTYEIVVPDEMCAFVRWYAPVYKAFPVGIGPDVVSYTVHDDESITDGENSRGGQPWCEFDHSRLNPDLPNCCLGSYERRVTYAESGRTVVTPGAWGGKEADCYAGAAYLEMGRDLTPEGWPEVKFIYTDWKPARHTVVYEYPAQYQSYTTVPMANYFDPEQHEGGIPAPFDAAPAQLTYEFQCVDDADETIARIRMQLREWNEEVEFDAEGNPDTEGDEVEWPFPLNDYPDWKDLSESGDLYPWVLGRP